MISIPPSQTHNPRLLPKVNSSHLKSRKGLSSFPTIFQGRKMFFWGMVTHVFSQFTCFFPSGVCIFQNPSRPCSSLRSSSRCSHKCCTARSAAEAWDGFKAWNGHGHMEYYRGGWWLRNPAITSWYGKYPIPNRVLLHPRWLFGMSEASTVCLGIWLTSQNN